MENEHSPSEKSMAARPAPVVVNPRRNGRVALSLFGGAAFMLGAAYAAVPLYDLFCKTTGFGGTPIVAKQAPTRVSERVFKIRFDANVAPSLGWKFQPEVEEITVKAGEVRTIGYTITSRRAQESVGVASFNVSPDQTGGYFNKIACFCFTDVTLKPGETRSEEVVFFIDPDIEKNSELDSVDTITLSYTFFPARSGVKPLADAGQLTGSRVERGTVSK